MKQYSKIIAVELKFIEENIQTLFNYSYIHSDSIIYQNKVQTIFPAYLVIEHLQNILEVGTYDVRKRVRKILTTLYIQLDSLESPQTAKNYWLQDTAHGKKYACPDDLDDTFRAFLIHVRRRNSFAKPNRLADITSLLLNQSKNDQGLYNTWISHDTRWQDYDTVINNLILRTLSYCKIPLSPLELALKQCPHQSLYYKPEDDSHSIERLLETHNHRQILPVYMERTGIFVGSEFLTSLRAIEKAAHFLARTKVVKQKLFIEENMHKKVVDDASSVVEKFTTIETVFDQILHQPIDSDATKSITLLPHRWHPTAMDQMLGAITLLGWISFTIYDHIVDEQHDAYKFKDLADHCFKELQNNIASLKPSEAIQREIQSLFETMHESHLIEKSGAIPPTHHKSVGHMLAPLLLDMTAGIDTTHTKIYFTEFLTIKQLSDDLHDWEEDVSSNRKTVVTEHIAKNCPSACIKDQRKYFAHNTMVFFSKEMIRRGDSALRVLKRLRKPRYFKDSIIKLQNGARRAILESQVVKILEREAAK